MKERPKTNFSPELYLGANDASLNQRLIQRLKILPAGTTICPGKLAWDCGTVLSRIRGHLLKLAAEGHVRLSQKGKEVSPQGLRGPFRVSLPTRGESKRVEK